jgi:hypothetical protein
MSTAPSFDRDDVQQHVELIHKLAAGIDGVLTVTCLEQHPHQEKSTPLTRRFAIGDVASMVDTIMSFEATPHINVYAPWSVFRKDLAAGKKGKEPDVVAVLAFVPDLDADTGKAGTLPIDAPYVIETSEGNFQPVYVLAEALKPADAKPLANALVDCIGCDARTKDTSRLLKKLVLRPVFSMFASATR